MPMERDRYPIHWEVIARQIKDKADWKCRMCGKQCRRDCRHLKNGNICEYFALRTAAEEYCSHGKERAE